MRTLVLVLASLISAPAWATDRIGSIVPPYPDGLSSVMTSCVAHDNVDCAYVIESLNNEDQVMVAIAATQITERDNGESVRKVIDMYDTPEATDGQMWAFSDCTFEGDIDQTIVGLITLKDMGGWTETNKTVWAVKFGADAEKLVMPDLSKVECLLPGL